MIQKIKSTREKEREKERGKKRFLERLVEEQEADKEIKEFDREELIENSTDESRNNRLNGI